MLALDNQFINFGDGRNVWSNSQVHLGRDMGGRKTYGGEENVPKNALFRKFLNPSKRASGSALSWIYVQEKQSIDT